MKFPIAVLMPILFAAVLPVRAAEHWIRVTTPHFEMYTTADEKKASEAILHFERVREFFMRASPVKPPGEFPTRIVAFRDSQEFRLYATNQQVAAYFAPGPVRDSIVMQDPTTENFPITIHEYVHLVIRHSGLHLPLWLNEGWAEVYSTLRPVKDGVAVGDLIPRHMTSLGQGEWFTLNQLESINNRSAEYSESSRTGMFYAESWALAHMLYLAPDYKDNFGKFIGALNRGRGMDEAVQTAFGKTSGQVYTDLRSYLFRKKLLGQVFLTPFQKSDEKPIVANVTAYDTDLMLADLFAASLHPVDAGRAYRRLEADDPKRPEAFEGAGYLAIDQRDKETAMKEFGRAFALGTADAQLCVQLATLEREARRPPGPIMEELERALKLRPDFPEALFQLGIMKVDARDFDGALALLARVSAVTPAQMPILYSALAYSHLQKGNLDAARTNAEALRKAARSPGETQGADRLVQLIDARSKGPAAVRPGEKVVRAEGTAVGVRCAAAGSGALSKMGINIGGKQVLFDLPEAAAVEITKQPGGTAELKCGPLEPFRLVVEFAPASVVSQDSAGIIRRLEF